MRIGIKQNFHLYWINENVAEMESEIVYRGKIYENSAFFDLKFGEIEF